MTKHTLFLVHGMGHYEGTDWSDKVWQKLVECSKRYPFFKTNDLNDWAEPYPIEYDKHLRDALARWDRQAAAFEEFAAGAELSIAGSLDWLTDISKDDAGFLLTHVTDVVMYYLFKLEKNFIQDSVKSQIAAEIHRRRGLDHQTEFSVMAHSLGTAVTHDALAELGAADTIDGRQNLFSAHAFKFASIHMLANVSHILQSLPEVYRSVIRPGSFDEADRYCLTMYSHRHKLDPFTLPRPFDRTDWGPLYKQSELGHYRGWNIHGWLHYLDHPLVHVPILTSITQIAAIPPPQATAAENEYEKFGGDMENVQVALAKIGELEALAGTLDLDGDLKKNFPTLKAMWKLIEELRGVGGDVWNQIKEVGL